MAFFNFMFTTWIAQEIWNGAMYNNYNTKLSHHNNLTIAIQVQLYSTISILIFGSRHMDLLSDNVFFSILKTT